MDQNINKANKRLTTPRAAAVAGIVFSVLLIASLTLFRISVPPNLKSNNNWIVDNWRGVELALNLVPFAGIAFLWFIGVVRDRLGEDEDRFFATVFLGSGLLFLAMLFVAAAVAGGTLSLFGAGFPDLPGSGLYSFGRVVSYEILNVYSMKMAGVFMISTCTLALRTGIFPRWMAFLGLLLALFLLLSLGLFYWAPVIFPLWTLLISVEILLANLRSQNADPSTANEG